MPVPQDTLWVVKPIGKYEPLYLEENIQKSISSIEGFDADMGGTEIANVLEAIKNKYTI